MPVRYRTPRPRHKLAAHNAGSRDSRYSACAAGGMTEGRRRCFSLNSRMFLRVLEAARCDPPSSMAQHRKICSQRMKCRRGDQILDVRGLRPFQQIKTECEPLRLKVQFLVRPFIRLANDTRISANFANMDEIGISKSTTSQLEYHMPFAPCLPPRPARSHH